MSIKAKNIIVGGENPPTITPKEEKVVQSFSDIKTINKTDKKIKVEPVEEPSRYFHKEDGELIRKINSKSQYLKDVFEDF